MEKFRLQGKNLFLSYQNTTDKNDLVVHLNKALFKFGVKYMIIGKNMLNLMIFVCLENTIDIRSRNILNFNENEANYRISSDVSTEISNILQSNEKWIEGNCDHPIYLLYQIKEKEKEKEFQKNEFIQILQEKELQKNEFIQKLNEKEKEFTNKMNERENELNLLNEKLQNIENINNNLNKSYERIKLHNEKFVQILTEIKSKSTSSSNVSIISHEEISEILKNWNNYVGIENQNKSCDVALST